MKIGNQDINIDDLVNDKYMHKMINDYVFLSSYEIEILNRYGIDPYKYFNIQDLMFEIDNILEEDSIEELEDVYSYISEYDYYANVDK